MLTAITSRLEGLKEKAVYGGGGTRRNLPRFPGPGKAGGKIFGPKREGDGDESRSWVALSKFFNRGEKAGSIWNQ